MKHKRLSGWLCLAAISTLVALFLVRRERNEPAGQKPSNSSTSSANFPGQRAADSALANQNQTVNVAPGGAAIRAANAPRQAMRIEPDAEREPQFAAFEQWLKKFEPSTGQDRVRLEAEGIELARQRRAAMFSLIQTDPDRALALAVTSPVREDLPATIGSLLESHVNARGDYEVLAALPLPGREKEVQPIQRTARLSDGSKYRAFPVRAQREFPTKFNIPLAGVAVDDALAIGNPVRVLSQAAATELAKTQPVDPVCSVSGELVANSGDATPVEVGGELHWLCHYEHAGWLNEKLLAAAGQTGGSSLDGATAESNYTEGRKRLILFRVAFPNIPTPALTPAAGTNLINNVDAYWRTISYGRTTVAPPGQGSDVVLVTLTLNSTDYDDDASKLRGDVRAAATASGIDLSKYDFDGTCVGGSPAFSFAGLGYVGAPGFWLANSYFGTATAGHEMGHNLGNPHANYWDTGGASAIGPGANEEYGDPYDIMGGGSVPNGHYMAKFKWRIGWISDVDFPRITSSGRFRIYCQDNSDSRGLRGLRFGHDGSLDYFVEFRQLNTGNNWLMNGLRLCWGGNGSSWTSQFIDTTPGSANGKSDSPIVIGSTFSDPGANVHVTPVGKGNTYPESLDVVVNIGSFPANQPPSVIVSASSTAVAAGASVDFAATATDPNGDALAYYWDFDDGGYSVNNSAGQSHSFASVGDYVVRCTVSDMKGGRTTDSVLVRVGTPATFSISGRVLDKNKPVAGVLMKAGPRSTYTDSDGTYAITRLAAGTYTVSASLYPYTLIGLTPGSVAVGPNAANIDFVNLPGGIASVTLVATGSVWKYLDNGSDQGTAWVATNFNDSAWASGPAQLGYGEGDEATVVSYGGASANKYITTYFRRAFTVADPSVVTNLALRLQRDDGGVVYLNGVEVYRDSMPAGAINYHTLANTTTDGEWVQTSLSSALVRPGTNVFAVEIHQVQPDSSDISFDLSLAGNATTSTQNYSALYLSSPADGSAITSPTNVAVTANAFFSGGSFSLLEFYADGVKFAEDASAPYAATWTNPANGAHTLTVRGTVASGGFQTSAPVNVTVAAPVPPLSVAFIPAGSVWKYLDNGSNQGTNWIAPTFNDSAWASGPAQLGYGDGDEATVVSYGGNANNKYITTYFRRAFTVTDPSVITNLAVALLCDDGGVVYLNGIEIFRNNLPNGSTINYNTPATNSVDDGSIFYASPVNPALLVEGTNVVSAEIHQTTITSSDMSFDLSLTGLASTNRPRGVYFTLPASAQTYFAPLNVPLAAVAIPAGGQSILRTEFYADENKLGEDSSPPFTLAWSNAPVGAFQLRARAFESGGAILTSAPVAVTISAPALDTELISTRGLWRYLDDGSDQGTNWTARNFDDSEWKQGYARLGYGGDGEYTTVSYGSDPNKRYITTYFRKVFMVNSLLNITNLKLLLSRDDGAVVYINGAEAYRANLASSPVSYNSLALVTMNAPDETDFTALDLSPSVLVAGTNVIAVEVHQSTINSSDLGLDLELRAEFSTNVSSGIYITAPAEGAHVTLPANLTVSAYASFPGSVIDNVTFYSDGLSSVAGTVPYSILWPSPAIGSHVLQAVALVNGSYMTSPPVNIVVDGPPALITPIFNSYIAPGSQWRYWSNGVTPAGNWTAGDYDDSAWSVGNAKFGWGLDGEVTTLPSGRTHYFRRSFNIGNPALLESLILQLQRDDGAVVYLNGVELLRSNMPGGVIAASTLALTTVDGLDEQTFFISQFPAAGILAGANVIAVEVHQASTASSDMGFDLQLNGAGTTAPRVVIGVPANNQLFVAPANVPLEAYASAGSGRAIASIEFYADGANLGSASASPFRFTWINAPFGPHLITARALDNFGAGITSAPVQIIVGYQPVSLTLVASNSVWKYLDNGSNQGTNWAQTNFNDSAWASGPAELGYGDIPDGFPEATVVSYGGNANAKFITTYFRRTFVVPSDTSITNLTFRLLRDDGAAVWLNGREMYRSNMPAGTLNFNTPAAASVGNADERTFFVTTLAASNVLAGTNCLAVEIHQNAINSSDISFDLQLEGDGYVLDTLSPLLEAALAGDQIKLKWPVGATGYTLRVSPQIGSGASWQPAVGNTSTSNGFNLVTIPATNGAAFYRLQKP